MRRVLKRYTAWGGRGGWVAAAGIGPGDMEKPASPSSRGTPRPGRSAAGDPRSRALAVGAVAGSG